MPEIDGLRFIAIFLVATFMHTTHFIDEKFFGNELFHDPYWRDFILKGGYGVSLFYMISGFILSLPFAKTYLDQEQGLQPPGLKQYYLRRLIRLEPPYIIALLFFFAANVWVVHKYDFDTLLPHLAASMFYVHNLIYNSNSWVLPIAWSLEVEVQFYLLAPLFFTIFLIKARYLRWIIYLLVIMAGLIYWQYYIYVFQKGRVHLFTSIHFFFCGIFLADLYVSKVRFIKSNRIGMILAIGCLLGLLFLPEIYGKIGLPLRIISLFLFFHIALTNVWLKKGLSIKGITHIGGMCYSIYLLHFGILSMGGSLLAGLNLPLNRHSYIPLYYIVFTVAILIISALYFIWVEKPFMKIRLRHATTDKKIPPAKI
jgi:peptidoglycan/LPS O-acetylase OafA/YrhL